MPKRTLGRTGLMVSGIALGTVELGLEYGLGEPGRHKKVDRAEAEDLVRFAIASGINLIDTAPGYGASEEIIGHAILGARENVVLASKISVASKISLATKKAGHGSREEVLNSIAGSLERLRTDWIDVLQIHNWDVASGGNRELYGALDEARAKGWVHWLGATVYGVETALAALETGLFDTLQVAYSVLDQRMQEEVLPRARELDVGIIARSILLKGVLTTRSEFLPPRLNLLRERSDAFRGLCMKFFPNVPFQAIAIAFGLNNSMIDSVLVGVSSIAELMQDLDAVGLDALPEGFVHALEGLKLDDPQLLNPATWGIP